MTLPVFAETLSILSERPARLTLRAIKSMAKSALRTGRTKEAAELAAMVPGAIRIALLEEAHVLRLLLAIDRESCQRVAERLGGLDLLLGIRTNALRAIVVPTPCGCPPTVIRLNDEAIECAAVEWAALRDCLVADDGEEAPREPKAARRRPRAAASPARKGRNDSSPPQMVRHGGENAQRQVARNRRRLPAGRAPSPAGRHPRPKR